MAVIHDFGGESIKLTPEAERLTAATARAQANGNPLVGPIEW